MFPSKNFLNWAKGIPPFRKDFLGVVLLVGLCCLFYPGLTYTDTCISFLEGLAKYPYMKIGNWQPILIHYLVMISHQLVGSFGLLFLGQVLCHILGTFLIFSCFFDFKTTVKLGWIFTLFPPILIWMIAPAKDGGMMAFFLLAVGSLGRASLELSHPAGNKRRIFLWFALSIMFCLYLVLLRHNGFLLTVPIIASIFLLITQRWWLRLLGFTTLFVGVIAFQWGVTLILLEGKSRLFPEQITFAFDMAAIAYETKETQFLIRDFDEHKLKDLIEERYTPKSVDRLYWYPEKEITLPFLQNEEEVKSLFEQWKVSVSNHPWIYLKHRTLNFLTLLLPVVDPVLCPLTAPSECPLAGCEAPYLVPGLTASVEWSFRSPMFRIFFVPLIYFLVCFWVLFRSLRRKMLITGVLASSAILYEAGYFFTNPSCHFRYSLPVIECAVLAFLIIITQRVQPRSQ